MAIYRKCKYCGKLISLREMQAGHWVAFDVGTDSVHNCGQVAAVQTRQTERMKPSESVLQTHSSSKRDACSVAIPNLKSDVDPAHNTDTTANNPLVATSYEDIRTLLDKAICGYYCVKMTYYRRYRSALTERVVEPLILEPGDRGGTVLRAYCRWREDIRSFALSNIRRAELLKETFMPRVPLWSTLSTEYKTPIRGGGSNSVNSRARTSAFGSTNWILWLVLGGIVLLWIHYVSQ